MSSSTYAPQPLTLEQARAELRAKGYSDVPDDVLMQFLDFLRSQQGAASTTAAAAVAAFADELSGASSDELGAYGDDSDVGASADPDADDAVMQDDTSFVMTPPPATPPTAKAGAAVDAAAPANAPAASVLAARTNTKQRRAQRTSNGAQPRASSHPRRLTASKPAATTSKVAPRKPGTGRNMFDDLVRSCDALEFNRYTAGASSTAAAAAAAGALGHEAGAHAAPSAHDSMDFAQAVQRELSAMGGAIIDDDNSDADSGKAPTLQARRTAGTRSARGKGAASRTIVAAVHMGASGNDEGDDGNDVDGHGGEPASPVSFQVTPFARRVARAAKARAQESAQDAPAASASARVAGAHTSRPHSARSASGVASTSMASYMHSAAAVSFIRVPEGAVGARAPPTQRCDPVSLFHRFRHNWSSDPFLAKQARRNGERDSVLNSTVLRAPQDQTRATKKLPFEMLPTYQVPTDKRRDNLRWAVRHKMMTSAPRVAVARPHSAQPGVRRAVDSSASLRM